VTAAPGAPSGPAPVTWRDAIPPGIGHLRRGHRRSAIKFLAVELAWIAVIVTRTRAVLDSLTFADFDRAVAALTLLLLPVGTAWWAKKDLWALENPASKIAGVSQWRISYDRLVSNPRAVLGFWCLGVLYLVALLRPVIAPYDPNRQPRDGVVNALRGPGSTVLVFAQEGGNELYATGFELSEEEVLLKRDPVRPELDKSIALSRLGRPKKGWSLPGEKIMKLGGRDVPYRQEFHLLGTDEQGRDLLSRIIYGSGISLWIGFLAMGIAVTIGTLVGATAGFFGGWSDMGLMRVVDVLLAFPLLLLLLLVRTFVESKSIWVVVAILGATGWMGISRLVRGQFLTLRELDFTTAARALGIPSRRIMLRHLLPNAMAPIIVNGTLIVGGTILTEAALSYLGYGVQPPDPSWGSIVQGGSDVLAQAWWIATLPGIAIVFTVSSFNLLGDALRDALDPRLRV
jgi:peptide/nickel transport system permease protein